MIAVNTVVVTLLIQLHIAFLNVFDFDDRPELLNLLQNNIADFEWKLVISNKDLDSHQTVHKFRSFVIFVSKELKN